MVQRYFTLAYDHSLHCNVPVQKSYLSMQALFSCYISLIWTKCKCLSPVLTLLIYDNIIANYQFFGERISTNLKFFPLSSSSSSSSSLIARSDRGIFPEKISAITLKKFTSKKKKKSKQKMYDKKRINIGYMVNDIHFILIGIIIWIKYIVTPLAQGLTSYSKNKTSYVYEIKVSYIIGIKKKYGFCPLSSSL